RLVDLLLQTDEADRPAWIDRLQPVRRSLVGEFGDRLASGAGEPAARSRAAGILLELAATDDGVASLLTERLEALAAPLPEETVVERAKEAGNLGAALILAGDERF